MKHPLYILRFDDICPTMKWSIWNRVEQIIYKYDIKPIIGVIPDNEDPELMIEEARPHYWEKLKEWQEHGWVIALHGYHHKYENNKGGIIKVNSYSEFAEVPYKLQLERLKNGIDILRSHGLFCNTWIAPAHSFDDNTVSCLSQIGIEAISDGYSSDVFWRGGLKWVPCQLYRFELHKTGVWTVCKHPSMWDEGDLLDFENEIEQWHNFISTLDDVAERFNKLTIVESYYNSLSNTYICNKNFFLKFMKRCAKYVANINCRQLIMNIINRGGHLRRSIKAGVTIGENCRLNDYPRWGSEPWLISLGNHVEISLNVTFLTHDGATWCFREQPRYKDVIRYGKITIEDNCFIGANSTILPGVTIGKNTIVGTCSVVTKNLEPNSVYAGVPARRICSINEYAEKCLRETPIYDKNKYKKNKKEEILRILLN